MNRRSRIRDGNRIPALPSNNRLKPNQPNRDPLDITPVRVSDRQRATGLSVKARDVSNSLFDTLIRPAIKSLIVDFFSDGIAMVIFGDENVRTDNRRRRSYNKIYDQGPSPRDRRRYDRPTHRMREVDVFSDIYFDKRQDASLALGRLIEIIMDYGSVSVGHFYELVGVESNYTHENWGWKSLDRCRIISTTDGYLIDFPEPVRL